ncbi:MAG: hypothetical protein WDN72_04590 [Alphaproteobacteria bacterium]
MRWIAEIAIPKPLTVVIEPTTLTDIRSGEKEEWFYLYGYENSRMIFDYMQETFQRTQSFALSQFQVPLDAWSPVPGPFRWTASIAGPRPLLFIICNDLLNGYALIVRDPADPKFGILESRSWEKTSYSSLADVEAFAQQQYGVPLDAWIPDPE